MEQLTKRQFIALEMIKQRIGLTSAAEDNQVEIVLQALKFADLFLDLSEDEEL